MHVTGQFQLMRRAIVVEDLLFVAVSEMDCKDSVNSEYVLPDEHLLL